MIVLMGCLSLFHLLPCILLIPLSRTVRRRPSFLTRPLHPTIVSSSPPLPYVFLSPPRDIEGGSHRNQVQQALLWWKATPLAHAHHHRQQALALPARSRTRTIRSSRSTKPKQRSPVEHRESIHVVSGATRLEGVVLHACHSQCVTHTMCVTSTHPTHPHTPRPPKPRTL